MTNLSDIIERLEKAEAGSRELDVHIAAALDIRPDWLITAAGKLVAFKGALLWQYKGHRGTSMNGLPPVECDPFTTSVDAAISLAEKVLPGAYAIEVSADPSGCGAKATHWPKGLGGENENRSEAVSQTMALALCRAILKAKAQQQEGGE